MISFEKIQLTLKAKIPIRRTIRKRKLRESDEIELKQTRSHRYIIEYRAAIFLCKCTLDDCTKPTVETDFPLHQQYESPRERN